MKYLTEKINLYKYIDEVRKLKAFRCISSSILSWNFYVWWKISEGGLFSKAPDSVSPWDMMDPSYWLYKQDYTVINYKTWQKLQVHDLKSLENFKKMVKDFK